MASNFKELNTLNLKRPAVVMVRKPFATDNEISDELRKLLFKHIPQNKKLIKNLVGKGKLKAVYFQDLILGTPYIEDDYQNVPYFDPKKVVYGTNIDSIVASSVDNKNYFSNICEESGGAGDMQISNEDAAKRASLSEWISKYSTTPQLQDVMFRRYTCWVLDRDFHIPIHSEMKHSDVLNPEVIESVELVKEDVYEGLNSDLTETDFAFTPAGKRILNNNTVYAIYRIIVKEGIGHMKRMSKAEMDSERQVLVEKYGLVNISKAQIDNQIKEIRSARNKLLNVRFYEDEIKYSSLENVYIPESLQGTISPYITNSDDFFTTFRIKKMLTENQEYLISPEYSTSKTYICPESNVEITLHNDKDNPTFTFYGFPYYKELIDAYAWFCRDFLAFDGQKLPYAELEDFLKRCVPLRDRKDTSTYGYEVGIKLRYAGREKLLPTDVAYYAYSGSALSYIVNSFEKSDVGLETIDKSYNVYDKNYWAKIPSILEFKYQLYKNVFTQYIKPRYDRLSKCNAIKIKQCQSGFVSDLKSLGIERNDLSDDSKLKIVELCENTLYNLYTGFYISNETTNDETVAKYSNTEIHPEYLSKEMSDALFSVGSSIDNINSMSNRDVSSVVVSRQVMGKSTCSVIIKNTLKKYNINIDSNIYGGDVVYEPMDEILVYFPDTSGNLVLSFKGYVSSVDTTVVNGYNSIVLNGDCSLKKIEMVRTNLKPSLSSEENTNSIIHPFIVPEEFFSSFEKCGLFMFAQGLSFFHSMLPKKTDGTPICKIEDNSPIFYDSLLTYLWYRASNLYKDEGKASAALEVLLPKYVTSIKHQRDKRLSDLKEESGIEDLSKSFEKNSKDGSVDVYNVTYNVYAQRDDSAERENKTGTVVAQILGTRQPSFILATKDINIVFSDYRTNLSILLEQAERFNFFFYSNREGVVQFRPPQIYLSELAFSKDGILDKGRVFGKYDLSYTYDSNILNNQTTSSYHSTVSDKNLINWFSVEGTGEYNELAGILTCVIENKPLAIKYGIKSQKTAAISGISNQSALYIYGQSLMDRNNKSFRSAVSTSMGFGDFDINSTVYSALDNTMYLREGLVLNYKSGSTFTAESTLNWGRKPLLNVPLTGDVSSLQSIDIDRIQAGLNKLFENNEITVAYYNQLKVLLDYVKKDRTNRSHLLTSFIFDGKVWDGVSSISFEDLVQVGFDSGISAVQGFTLAVGLSKTNVKTVESLKKFQKDFAKENSSYYLNSTGRWVSTIYTDTKDKAEMIFVNKVQA